VHCRPPGARPGYDHDPDPAARKPDDLGWRAQPAPSNGTHSPAVEVDPGTCQPTTPWLPQPDSKRPGLLLLDDSSTLASGAVASEFGPSLHTLAPDDEQAPGGSVIPLSLSRASASPSAGPAVQRQSPGVACS
jgi:hypothetical protein